MPNKHPPGSPESDIDDRQFEGLSGTGTTDALAEMVHTWYEATDKSDTFVRVLLVDYSKAFDHINHEILIAKLCGMGLPAHLVRWMAAFLIDRQQCVKIGDTVSNTVYRLPQWRRSSGNIVWPQELFGSN